MWQLLLDLEEVLLLHGEQLAGYGGSAGVRDQLALSIRRSMLLGCAG